MQAVGNPLGIANQPGRSRVLADTRQDALARRPGSLDGVRLHLVEQLLIDALSRAPQRQLAQSRQIGRGKEMVQGSFGLSRDVDFSFPEARDQVGGREVDQLDGVGAIEHGVGHRLADAHMSDLSNDVIEAFDVLDVDGRVNIDAVTHQLFDIEITLWVAAAFGVGVRKLVNENDLRPAGDNCVEVHLLEPLTLIKDAPPRNDFEAGQQRFGVFAAVRLNDADDDVVAVFLTRLCLLQHLIGLADTRRCADEDFEFADAPFFAARRFEERFRRGPMFRIAPLFRHFG